MAQGPPADGPALHRLLGGPNSWRRVVLAGLGGGVVLALTAALLAAFLSDSGSGSLDPLEPTLAAPAGDVAPADGVPPPDAQPAPTEPPPPPPPTDVPPPAQPPPPTDPPPPAPTDTPPAPSPPPPTPVQSGTPENGA